VCECIVVFICLPEGLLNFLQYLQCLPYNGKQKDLGYVCIYVALDPIETVSDLSDSDKQVRVCIMSSHFLFIYPIAFGLPATVPYIGLIKVHMYCYIGSIKVHMYWLIEGAHIVIGSMCKD